MTPDPYLNAYETARTELAQITMRFDQLRARKSHIENLVVVLQQTLGAHGQPTIEPQAEMEAMSSQRAQETAPHVAEQTEPENYSFHQVPSPSPLSESSGDPFERRVKTSFRFRGISAQRY
jgi:hypothetical protein